MDYGFNFNTLTFRGSGLWSDVTATVPVEVAERTHGDRVHLILQVTQAVPYPFKNEEYDPGMTAAWPGFFPTVWREADWRVGDEIVLVSDTRE